MLYRNFFQIKPKRETKCYLSTIYCYDFFSLWSTQAKEKIRFEMTHDELYSFYNQVGGFEIHIYMKYMYKYIFTSSSHELKGQVSFSDPFLSGVHLSVRLSVNF